MQQMDFVDVVQKGILQEAYYEALYPQFFKTLIPLAFINKLRIDLNKQRMLEKVKEDLNVSPGRKSSPSKSDKSFEDIANEH